MGQSLSAPTIHCDQEKGSMSVALCFGGALQILEDALCTLSGYWKDLTYSLTACFFLHRRQLHSTYSAIYSIWYTEGRAQKKNSCNTHRVGKHAFSLAFLWFNQEGSKGWNTKTAPWLLAKVIDAKAISQSRQGKSQEQRFLSKQEIFNIFKSHYSGEDFCFQSGTIFTLSIYVFIY